MKLWFDGFIMAWGMFLAIPTPSHRWNEAARRHMMQCLPLIGCIIGALWALAAWLLRDAPLAIRAMILAALPWLLSGFLHLDGYMDVCDAVLSRRDLETRQRILKDSHCGAFAVIGIVLLALAQWSVLLSAARIALLPLAAIPAATRACAALAVQLLRPLGTSQYAAMTRRGLPLFPVMMLLLAVILPAVFCGIGGFAPLAAALGYSLAAWYGVRQLGGMNGDISGFALSLGELMGAAFLILVG